MIRLLEILNWIFALRDGCSIGSKRKYWRRWIEKDFLVLVHEDEMYQQQGRENLHAIHHD
jgi:hypothetical protein